MKFFLLVNGALFLCALFPNISFMNISTLNKNLELSKEDCQESLYRFELLSAATKEGIWEVDLITGSVFYNDGIKKMLGYTEEEMADNSNWWRNNLHPHDKSRIISSLDDFLESRSIVWWGKYQFRCADGSYKLIVDRLVVIRDGDFKPQKLTGTMQDFAELNDLQQELYEIRISQRKEMYRAVLEAEEKEKMYISDSLNENTNQILAAITMHIGQARQYVSPEGKKWLIEANHMLQESINGIHNLAHRLSPASLHLLGITDALDHMLRDMEKRHNISYVLEVDELVAQRLDTAENMIFYRIAQYQLSNIEEHSNATRIMVSLQEDKGKTTITIHDNGDGVDLKELKYGQGFSNIEQRSENFDGIFALESDIGIKGFSLTVTI